MVCIEIERLYCLGPNVPDFANVEATEFDKCELLVGFQKVKWGASTRWSSPLYFPLRNSDQINMGKTRRTVECARERFKTENQPDFFFWIFFLVSWARKSSVKMQCKIANHCKHCLNHIIDYANIELEEDRTVRLQ